MRYVFGPVPSRRLGRSLGVDLVPYKTCSYDCIYCQLGVTTDKTVERREWVPLEDVIAELRGKLDSRPDYITLSGSGDNYAQGAQHNAQFYLRPSDQRMLYFPHDLDAFYSTTRPVVGNSDLSKLISVPAYARLYYGHLYDIISSLVETGYQKFLLLNGHMWNQAALLGGFA